MRKALSPTQSLFCIPLTPLAPRSLRLCIAPQMGGTDARSEQATMHTPQVR